MKMINTLVISFFFIINCYAQDHYSEAWKYVDNGDLTTASELFFKSAKESRNPDAWLALAFIEELKSQDNISWEYFKKALALLYKKDYYLLVSTQSRSTYYKFRELDKYLIDSFYEMAENKEDGFINTLARVRLGYYLQQQAHLTEALELFKGMQTVKEWSLIGPFDNTSGSGFNIKYIPELEFDKEKKYNGKSNCRVVWYDLKKIRNDGWIDFNQYLLSSDGIYYANNFVWSPSKQKIHLRTGTSGSLKLFLNDQLLFENEEETNNHCDTYIVETYLQKGWNKVLVKVGFSEIDKCNFMLRITDEKGFAIDGLRFSTAKENYSKISIEEVRIIKTGIEKYFEERLEKDSLNPINYILLGQVYNQNDKRHLVEKTYSRALEKFPNNIILAAHLYLFFDRTEKYVRANSVAEQIKRRDIQIPLLTEYQLRDNTGSEDNQNNFISIYEGIKFKKPDSPRWLQLEILYKSYKDQVSELFALVDSAYQKYPSDYSILGEKYTAEYYKTNDLNKAVLLLENYCSRYTSVEALKRLAQVYLSASRREDWERTYKKILLYYPSDASLYNNMAVVFYQSREYDKAIEFGKQALEISPFESAYHYNLGLYYLGLNNSTEAIRNFKNSIDSYPFYYNARDALYNLEGPDPIEKELKLYNINQLVEEALAESEKDGNNLIFYLIDTRSKFYEGGVNEFEFEVLAKVINSSGLNDFSHISFDKSHLEKLIIDKAFVIKPGGKEVKAEINDNEIVFNSLEVNDFLYYKFKVRSLFPGVMAQDYHTYTFFSHQYPAKKTRYSIIAPANVHFYFRGNNMEAAPSYVKTAGDKKLYVWEKNNLSEIDSEYGMPPLEDAGSVLYITTLSSWSLISDWYYNVTRSKLRAHFLIKNKVEELLKGNNNLSDLEKVTTIYNYVRDNISYVYAPFIQSAIIPRNADDILLDQVGDCKDMVTLFIAMLQEAGIKADYVLVRSSSYGRAQNTPPSFIFDHVIAVTYLSGEKQYYDLTAIDHPIGVLPAAVKNAFALEIRTGNAEPIIINRRHSLPTIINRITEVNLNKDNSADVVLNTTRKGEAIPWFLQYYKGLSPDKIIKLMTEGLSGSFSGSLITDVIIDSSGLDDHLKNTITLKINNLISKVGNYKFFKIPWLSGMVQDQGLSYENRTQGYQMFYVKDEDYEEITIHLPEGYEPVELPENLNLSSPLLDFNIAFSYNKGVIKGKKLTRYKSDYISPEDYRSHKDIYDKIMSIEASQILIQSLKDQNKSN
jgi:tetratricopeptide (TPR) repeat protein